MKALAISPFDFFLIIGPKPGRASASYAESVGVSGSGVLVADAVKEPFRGLFSGATSPLVDSVPEA